MDMERVIVGGVVLALLYFMIFHTEKWKEINNEGHRQIEKTGGVLKNGVKGGIAIWKLFKRR